VKLPATTSQTVGPYFNLGLSPRYRENLADPGMAGERITIQGRILDAAGQPVPDAILELWQANREGKYPGPDQSEIDGRAGIFPDFGRVPTDENGFFRFSTIKPGNVLAPDGSMQAPHILVSIFMRGLLLRLVTRIYFAGDPLNEADFVLKRVDTKRRITLMAAPVYGAPGTMEWNIILQGENETIFFDC
jgi:protocatechuate 3,4-dioxygenase alpha subunit